jgi:hypothetical protein
MQRIKCITFLFIIGVNLFDSQHIYEKEIHLVCRNGALLSCQGVMTGQLMVVVNPDEPQNISFLMMTSSPDFERIQKVFKELIENKFPNCILPLFRSAFLLIPQPLAT